MTQREDKAAYMRAYYARSEKHRIRSKAQSSRWAKENREYGNFRNNLRRHALTLDQYHAKLEAQDFCCAICGKPDPEDIDHDHETDRRRGILCHGCNTAIGLLQESPALFQRAVGYLQQHDH